MPPPTAGDNWLNGRHFGIVIDAGSSGSRLQIYSWRDPQVVIAGTDKTRPIPAALPAVEKGSQSEEWSIKVEPGISSFTDDPKKVASYLRPLLEYAREHVPPSLQHETPIFLLATAGMRLLPPQSQAEILQEACRFLVLHSRFKIDDPSPVGPCGSSVRIITGEEEGLFGWIAVNYLMDGFVGANSDRTTYGFLDMGGASTQIAFEPSIAEKEDERNGNLIDVRLRLLNGEVVQHKVFVTTWLGYGTNQARERYVGRLLNELDETHSVEGDDVVPDPCLPKDLERTETPAHVGNVSAHANRSHVLRGTGSFEKCMEKTQPLLNNHVPCARAPCLMNGVHVPPIDFSVSHFIGVSEYWYASEHVFGLGGPYDFVQYGRAASEFCSRDWAGIMVQHERSRDHNRLGGDGEVLEDGYVVEVGKWGDSVELSRLEMQCFKAAWIANVLHEGIGMPRIVDPGGNPETKGDQVAQQAQEKGLGKPTFQSIDSMDDIAISWTLGKMVLEASKEVPFLDSEDKPLVDPLDDVPISPNSTIQPIRPPFWMLDAIEDRISPHLPASLTRTALGFSPVLFLFYAMLMIILITFSLPLRHRIRSFLRSRNAYRNMEEGRSFGSPSLSGSLSSSKWLRRILPGTPRRHLPPPLNINLTYQSPLPLHETVFSAISTSHSRVSISRSPSPSSLMAYENGLNPESPRMSTTFSTSLSNRGLSRNSSQINLSVPPKRQAVSRISSGASTRS